ncbi:hypothetical protein CCACVL1_25596 [Corchorus capsularis]|uniref:Uncharacterized protein n=1 Tax=Corchorus capsularis TaxID=210143 RepID=A0A1R3GJ10_COCAP|nr:hypothetical protein CCACVL1_25596 [Corchorus capsularis]
MDTLAKANFKGRRLCDTSLPNGVGGGD